MPIFTKAEKKEILGIIKKGVEPYAADSERPIAILCCHMRILLELADKGLAAEPDD